jgi:HSF-type DNA-binding
MSPEEIAASALAGLDSSIAATTAPLEHRAPIANDRGTPSLQEVAKEASARLAVDSSAAVVSTEFTDAADSAGVPHNIVFRATGVPAAASDHPLHAGSETTGNKPKRRGPKPKIKLPVEPRLIQSIPKRKEYINHTYSDYSIVPPLDPNYQSPTSIAEMTFVEKVHDILSKPEYEPWIAWRPHGRAFGITVPTMFEKVVCEPYFGHKRYSSFLRQINNHGFKHLTKDGPDRNCYYHEVG